MPVIRRDLTSSHKIRAALGDRSLAPGTATQSAPRPGESPKPLADLDRWDIERAEDDGMPVSG